MSKPANHGHDHRPVGWYGPDDPGGADPTSVLSNAIRFNVDNQGGYLLVVANDHIPADDSSIRIQALEDGLGDGGDFELLAENIMFIQGGGEVQITATAGPIVLNSATSPLLINVNGQTFSFKDDGTIQLPGGGIIGP